jgi:nucleotide-binding universal stress UspA family protein
MMRPLFDRVVMATDLSPAWDEIVFYGGELLELGCRSVILTYVITPNLFDSPGESLPPQSATRLEKQRQSLVDRGLEVIMETPTGLPGVSLNEVARKYDAPLVIVGSHGQSRWREGVLGTFSAAVLHNVRVPVLVLPVRVDEGREPSCPWHCTELLDHLLFPTDFSQTAAEALCYLELLALRGVNRVTLLHALERSPAPSGEPRGVDEAAAVARNFLDLLQGRLEAAGVPEVETLIFAGHPISVILKVIKDMDASMIMLGTQGKDSIEEISLGSVAHNISRFTPCPLLLIPPADRDICK